MAIKVNSKQKTINNNKIIAEAGVLLKDLIKLSIDSGLTGLEWTVGIPGTIGGAVKVNASAFNQSISKAVKKIKKLDEIILSIELELKKGERERSKRLINQYLKKRKATQPLDYPSAGCIFKNPLNRNAGYLIEQCGLKGKKIGQAMISEKHANFIINLDGAKARDVLSLIKLIKEDVKKRFNIELEEEIEYVGF